jgi:hypothetical protein
MNAKNLLKTITTYIGIYCSGVLISASFVLYSNEMFYISVFKGKSPLTGEKIKFLHEVKPREIIGNSAKQTFLKHKLDEEENDDARIYHNYIQNKKNSEMLNNNSIYTNIYDKKI